VVRALLGSLSMKTIHWHWDWDIGVCCTACGHSLWEDLDLAFCFAAGSYLCACCAKERGGVYDPLSETWTVPPDVRDSGVLACPVVPIRRSA
jgi:hypothetical protein